MPILSATYSATTRIGNEIMNLKTENIMGIAYKVKCKHCGAEFAYSQDQTFGMMPRCVGCESYIETESPIRCPACNRRLNATQEEFNEQVQTVMMWD